MITADTEYPNRHALVNELHARPFPNLSAPGKAIHLAFKAPENESDLARVYGVRELTPPQADTFTFDRLDEYGRLALEGLEFILKRGVIQAGSLAVAEGPDAPRIQVLRSSVVSGLKVSPSTAPIG